LPAPEKGKTASGLHENRSSGAKQAIEKSQKRGEKPEIHPSAAKAALIKDGSRHG
jgi:hypothetical protein